MDNNIQIEDNMPAGLKNAINYLNSHNVTAADLENFDVNDDDEMDLVKIDGDFLGEGYDSSDVEYDGVDNVEVDDSEFTPVDFGEASNLDLDDLDSVF